jgi:hypothetical protein
MPDAIDDVDQASIVLLGRFDAGRLHPNDTIMQELLTPADTEVLRVTLLLPGEVIEFQTQFLVIHADGNRLSITSQISAPIPQKVRDFMAELLLSINMPVTAMGINRDIHFPVRSAEKFVAIRDQLIKRDSLEGVLKNGLIRSLLFESDRYDAEEGKIYTRIEPSMIIRQGVFIQVNDHISFPSTKLTNDLSSSLFEKWTAAIDNAQAIVSKVRSLTE